MKATLTDGRSIEFSEKQIGSGKEKVGFFSLDEKEVVLLFRAGLNDRAGRRNRMELTIERYNPTLGNHGEYWKTHYCWPTGIIDGDPAIPADFLRRNGLQEPVLGVVVPAYPKNFYFNDIRGLKKAKNSKWFTGPKARMLVPRIEKGFFRNHIRACAKMARAVRRMHFAGLAHSDLSNANVLIDPMGGDACLSDLDSLVVPGMAPPVVIGTPNYIAPEVLRGIRSPCIATDQHALAVLLYEMLLLRHPLCGRRTLCDDPIEDDRLTMGECALYVEHPNDKANHLWPPPAVSAERLGPYLHQAFLKTFVKGLHTPEYRTTASEWESALYRTYDLLHPSPESEEWFVLAPGLPLECPWSKRRITHPVPIARFHSEYRGKPGQFAYDGHTLTIHHHLSLMKWHTNKHQSPGENAHTTPQGYFAFWQNKWYLVNESDSPMQIMDGATIPKGTSIEITSGLQIRLSPEPDGRLLFFEFMEDAPGSNSRL